MTEMERSMELSTNATLAAGLALLAVVAVGGGGLVASLDGAQVGYYLSDGSAGWTAGGGAIGSGGLAIGGAVGGLLGGPASIGLINGMLAGGIAGAIVGGAAGAL